MTNRRRLFGIMAEAGLEPDEIDDDPELGLLVNRRGLEKMVRHAPNPGPGKYLLEWLAQQQRRRIRAVEPRRRPKP
jgi:hypothetical protein